MSNLLSQAAALAPVLVERPPENDLLHLCDPARNWTALVTEFQDDTGGHVSLEIENLKPRELLAIIEALRKCADSAGPMGFCEEESHAAE